MAKRWIALLALVCLLAGCGSRNEEPTLPPPEANPYGAADFGYEGEDLTCLTGPSRRGIDVSSFQGEIDWEAVAADGIDFAMIRVGYRGISDGRIGQDAAARANLEGALAAGLDVGVYFFSQAVSTQEAAREAAFVISFLEDWEITMPVVYDWEPVDSEDARTAGLRDRALLTDCALTFLEAVETAGYSPMVYFNGYMARELLDLRVLRDYDFWLALYGTDMTFPYALRMWQYTDAGTVEGIQGKVDVNLFLPAAE